MRYLFLGLSIFVALLTIIVAFQNLGQMYIAIAALLFNPLLNTMTGWVVLLSFFSGILTATFFALYYFNSQIFRDQEVSWGEEKRDILSQTFEENPSDQFGTPQTPPQNQPPQDWGDDDSW